MSRTPTRVDVPDALRRLGLDSRGNGDNAMLRCPFHEDAHASLSIKLEDGVWNCKGCGEKGSLAKLWGKVKGIPGAEARGEIRAIYGATVNTKDVEKWERGLGHEAAQAYLTAHAIPPSFAAEHGLGFDGEHLTIPIRDRTGTGLLSVKKRRLVGDGPKCLNEGGAGSFVFPLWLWDPKAERTVVVEGETDALALHAIGVNAITMTTGAGALTATNLGEYLGDREVFVCLDTDDAGTKAARKLVRDLGESGVNAWMTELPDGADVCDVLAKRISSDRRDAFEQLLADSIPWADVEPDEEHAPYEWNQRGMARRFAHMHGMRARWISEPGEWWTWTGAHWSRDVTAECERLGQTVIAEVRKQAARARRTGDEEEAEALGKLAFKAGQWTFFSGMMRQVRSALTKTGEPMSMSINKFNIDPMLLPVRNGIVDLRTGELIPHDPENYNDRAIELDYDPDATCPLWEETLAEVLAKKDGMPDPDTVFYFQRVLGYCLTGNVDEDALFLLYGTGANGKSMIVKILHALLGPFCRAMDFRVFLSDGVGNAVDYHKSRMRGARVLAASEVGEGRKFDEALIKSLTGRDEVTARDPRGKPFSFDPTHKIVMSVNNRPTITGTDRGIWRRMFLVPFEQSFDPDQGGRTPDRSRPEKLMKEISGILAWAVRGAMSWHERTKNGWPGLEPTPRCQLAADDYKQDMDPTGGFVDAWLQTSSRKEPLKTIYSAYEIYCKQDEDPPIGKRIFASKLRDRGIKVKRSNGLTWVYAYELTPEAKVKMFEAEQADQNERRW